VSACAPDWGWGSSRSRSFAATARALADASAISPHGFGGKGRVLLSRFAAWSRSPRARPPAAGSRRAPFRDAGGGDLSHPPSRAGEASVLLLLLYDSLAQQNFSGCFPPRLRFSISGTYGYCLFSRRKWCSNREELRSYIFWLLRVI
jgi:hypothetical protein